MFMDYNSFTLLKSISFYMCGCVYVCTTQYLGRAEDIIGLPGPGVLDGLSPCGNWEPNLDPLEEHQVLLTTKSSLHPQISHFCFETGFLFVILAALQLIL